MLALDSIGNLIQTDILTRMGTYLQRATTICCEYTCTSILVRTPRAVEFNSLGNSFIYIYIHILYNIQHPYIQANSGRLCAQGAPKLQYHHHARAPACPSTKRCHGASRHASVGAVAAKTHGAGSDLPRASLHGTQAIDTYGHELA